MFLLILDAHSKWPEIFSMKSNTQSDNLIKAFKNVFSRYGLCDHVVSDNGSQYKSDEFNKFLKQMVSNILTLLRIIQLLTELLKIM